jgi:hypothetical protein
MERRRAVKRSVISFSVVLVLSSLLAGCGGAPSVEQVRWEMQRRFPDARFEREAHIRLGHVSLALIRGLVHMVPGKVDGQEFLDAVHRIDVATYRVSSLPNLDRIQGETRFEEQLARTGWSMTVRTREEDSRAWIFTRSDPAGAIRGLFVVTLEDDELTLARIDGRLDQALAEAIAEHPKRAVRAIEEGDEESVESSGS